VLRCGVALALALLAAPARAGSSGREIRPDWLGPKLEAAIRHRMSWPADAVRVVELRLPPAFSVPEAASWLRVRFAPREDFCGWVEAALEFAEAPDAEPAVRRSASARLAVELPVPVLAAPLPRGAVLDDGAVRLEARELSELPADRVPSIEALRGARLAQALPGGTALRFAHVEAPDLVRHGDPLEVRAGPPGLQVVLAARALERGKLGQVIDAENQSSRRRFAVVLTGPGEAELVEPGVGARR
jgi:flagella basal body P-ring formation protein FlgA